MHYVSMIVTGLIVGIAARFIYPGPVHLGLIASAVLGILGSVLAGVVGGMIHRPADGAGLHPAGFVYSVLGALVLIFIARNVFHLV